MAFLDAAFLCCLCWFYGTPPCHLGFPLLCSCMGAPVLLPTLQVQRTEHRLPVYKAGQLRDPPPDCAAEGSGKKKKKQIGLCSGGWYCGEWRVGGGRGMNRKVRKIKKERQTEQTEQVQTRQEYSYLGPRKKPQAHSENNTVVTYREGGVRKVTW